MKYDFEVRAGNTGTVKNEIGLELTLKAGSPPAPVDLSDSEFVFIVRPSAGQKPVIRKTSASGGGIVVTTNTGKVSVPLTVADTRALWGAATGQKVVLQYELERRRTSPATQRTVLHGTVTVLPGVNDD